MTRIALRVNGHAVEAEVPPETLVVEFLRRHLHLTGAHVGCETTQCGACAVHLDGLAVKSCTVLAVQADGAAVTTIEGLAPPDGPLHPMQAAFRDHHALQCGYCTPGMVMTAVIWCGAWACRTRTRSASNCRATSAAAPAITTSSAPSRPARRRWRHHGAVYLYQAGQPGRGVATG